MRSLAAALVCLAFGLPACSEAGTEVEMVDGRRFEPESLEVEAGATITFRNTASDAHTVTAIQESLPDGAPYFASGGFDSEQEAVDDLAPGLVAQGESYQVTFEEPGKYEYYCIPHQGEGMSGEIVVR